MVQWLKKVKTQRKGAKKPKSITITTKNIKERKQLQRVKNRKASGLDSLQGYWIKAFEYQNERTAVQHSYY